MSHTRLVILSTNYGRGKVYTLARARVDPDGKPRVSVAAVRRHTKNVPRGVCCRTNVTYWA